MPCAMPAERGGPSGALRSVQSGAQDRSTGRGGPMAVPCARPAEREGQFIVLTPRSDQPVFVTALPGGGDWGVGGSSRSSLRQTQSSAPDRSNGCGGADGGASVPGRRGLPRQVSGRIVSGCSAREVTLGLREDSLRVQRPGGDIPHRSPRRRGAGPVFRLRATLDSDGAQRGKNKTKQYPTSCSTGQASLASHPISSGCSLENWTE